MNNRRQSNKESSPDDLTKTTSKGNVELTEEDLNKAAGGQLEYLKIKLSDVQVTKV